VDLGKEFKNWQRRNFFRELVWTGDQRKTDSSDIPRLYVLVRADVLPPLHQGIQAAHACLMLAAQMKVNPNSYLILLAANLEEMMEYSEKAKKKACATFVDTGLIDPETMMPLLSAMAFEPMSLAEGNKLFTGLRRSE
jgi:hypothetical protein